MLRVTLETNQAAQADPLDAFVQEAIDQDSGQSEAETPIVESAPTEEEVKQEVTEVVKPTEDGNQDGFQKRINKVTAGKYAAERERDALQAKLDALNKAPVSEPTKAPTLEDSDIDYDEDKLRQAQVSYQVQQELTKHTQTQSKEAQQVKDNQAAIEFNGRIQALGKEDFSEKANAIPDLPVGVADALMQSENGAELIYHLGSHLDKADALSQMTPAAAMMELGRLSVDINKQPEIKTSAAPEPIEPIKSGSALSSDVGDDMSISDWMAKYN